jgi:IS30 family transposase
VTTRKPRRVYHAIDEEIFDRFMDRNFTVDGIYYYPENDDGDRALWVQLMFDFKTDFDDLDWDRGREVMNWRNIDSACDCQYYFCAAPHEPYNGRSSP